MFFVFAFQSSYLALSDAFVGPDNHTNELRSLRPALHGKQTLALFYDDYVSWELLGTPTSSPLLPWPIPLRFRPDKPWSYGQALDFDSVRTSTSTASYVITTRTDGLSQPPPNFHLVGSSRSYEVWHRVGPTPAHAILGEAGSPGAVLDCHTPTGAGSRRPGVAVVRPPPSPSHPPDARRVRAGGAQSPTRPMGPVAPVPLRSGGDDQVAVSTSRCRRTWIARGDVAGGTCHQHGGSDRADVNMADPGDRSDRQFFAPQPLVAVRPGPTRSRCVGVRTLRRLVQPSRRAPRRR